MPDIQRKIKTHPTKSFFIKTLVKDIQLADAILDLIDNSIDNYIRMNFTERKIINITFSKERFEIEDNCGGINEKNIYDHVFRFGKQSLENAKTIGVYGIGLKRAIFKIGENIIIESDDGKKYFKIQIDKGWLSNEDNWDLDLELCDRKETKEFTKISITELFEPILRSFDNNIFANDLIDRIMNTYSIFLEDKIDILINGTKVKYYDFEFLYEKDKFIPRHNIFEIDDDVQAELYAGYTPKKDEDNLYGWFIFCNDRLIIKGDTSEKTGWEDTRKYHYPEDNRFLGLAFLRSNKPFKLPWHTTKEDVQEDSIIYKNLQEKMRTTTKPFIDLIRLAGRTRDTETNETIGKSLFENVSTKHRIEIKDVLTEQFPTLNCNETSDNENIPSVTSIQYYIEKSILKRVKQKMGDSNMSNREAGEKTFEYYRKMEANDDE